MSFRFRSMRHSINEKFYNERVKKEAAAKKQAYRDLKNKHVSEFLAVQEKTPEAMVILGAKHRCELESLIEIYGAEKPKPFVPLTPPRRQTAHSTWYARPGL